MKSLHARIADELMRLAAEVEEQAELIEECSNEAEDADEKKSWAHKLHMMDRVAGDLAWLAMELLPSEVTLPLEKDEPTDEDNAADYATMLTEKKGYPHDND